MTESITLRFCEGSSDKVYTARIVPQGDGFVVQVIARGLTAPLREMAAAAEAMARGEHGQQVEVRGRDEVGRLADAFNAMSTELETTDRVRRELVANVAHELRTPLAGLQAALENDIDGVQPLDEALAAMVEGFGQTGRKLAAVTALSVACMRVKARSSRSP